jgi:hypothetical protein
MNCPVYRLFWELTVSMSRLFWRLMRHPQWGKKYAPVIGLHTLAMMKFHLSDLLRLGWSSTLYSRWVSISVALVAQSLRSPGLTWRLKNEVSTAEIAQLESIMKYHPDLLFSIWKRYSCVVFYRSGCHKQPRLTKSVLVFGGCRGIVAAWQKATLCVVSQLHMKTRNLSP